MAGYTAEFAVLLESILDGPFEDTNDFVSLAITGEELRRALVLEESPTPAELEALARYDRRLGAAGLRQLAPGDLGPDLESALSALGPAAVDDDALVGVDEVLMVAAAGARAGALADAYVVELGQRARAVARERAPWLWGVWDLAEARSCTLGPDVRFEGLYDWLDELGQLSELRARACVVVRWH